MEICYSVYRCSPTPSPASIALDHLLSTENPDKSYSQMMRFRLSGRAAEECYDTYFIATDAGVCVSRHWHGWGLHSDAIGNFGNFRTAEDHRLQGIGRRLLQMWFEDLQAASQPPIGLFCTAACNLLPVYGKFGFRVAVETTASRPLYCPVGGSPETFREFCEEYYVSSRSLRFLPGTIGYRHEIDCLLNFALRNENMTYGLQAFPSYEAAFLALQKNPALGTLERVASDNGHTVGWAYTPKGEERQLCIHPKYASLLR